MLSEITIWISRSYSTRKDGNLKMSELKVNESKKFRKSLKQSLHFMKKKIKNCSHIRPAQLKVNWHTIWGEYWILSKTSGETANFAAIGLDFEAFYAEFCTKTSARSATKPKSERVFDAHWLRIHWNDHCLERAAVKLLFGEIEARHKKVKLHNFVCILEVKQNKIDKKCFLKRGSHRKPSELRAVVAKKCVEDVILLQIKCDNKQYCCCIRGIDVIKAVKEATRKK